MNACSTLDIALFIFLVVMSLVGVALICAIFRNLFE